MCGGSSEKWYQEHSVVLLPVWGCWQPPQPAATQGNFWIAPLLPLAVPPGTPSTPAAATGC